jgi:hypothetical protein
MNPIKVSWNHTYENSSKGPNLHSEEKSGFLIKISGSTAYVVDTSQKNPKIQQINLNDVTVDLFSLIKYYI